METSVAWYIVVIKNSNFPKFKNILLGWVFRIVGRCFILRDQIRINFISLWKELYNVEG